MRRGHKQPVFEELASLVLQDFLDNDLNPVMEESAKKRNKGKVEKIWQQMSRQLQEWKDGSASSLYGEDSPTIEIGHFQKKFAKVKDYVQGIGGGLAKCSGCMHA